MNRLALVSLFLVACGAEPSGPSGEGTSGGETPPPEQCTATLRVESMDEADASGMEMPRARITAVRHCERSGSTTLEVGVETGICSPAGVYGEGVVAHVTCWWAGAGSEIELVRRGDTLVIRKTAVDEMTGPAAPEELGGLGLPENCDLVPLSDAGR